MKANVLTPLTQNQLRAIFNEDAIKVVDYFITKSLFSQPEIVYGQEPLPIQIPKEHIEQWIVQAIGATPVGSGSYPVDVIKQGDFGADVKMLSCKVNINGQLVDSDSGETSLAQKFQEAGNQLDQLFEQKQYDSIVDGWKSILFNKLQKVFNEQNVKNIYYFFILRAGNIFYLCGLHVNIDLIQGIKASRGTSSSIFIDHFIDEKFGNTKIYKAKKRLELRLRPKYWVDNNLVIPFDLRTKHVQNPVNLLELVKNNQLEAYKNQIIQSIFNK